MNKKFIPLVIVSGLVSALLLFAGTAFVDRLAPVYASRLPALLAGGSSASDNLEVKNNQGASITVPLPSKKDDAATVKSQMSGSGTDDSIRTPEPIATLSPQSTSLTPTSQVSTVSIAELAANPAQYSGMVVSVSGIATNLDGDKFLLNDGTGQIIVDLEDNMAKIIVLNGSQVVVLGQFKARNDGVEVDACVINNGSGNVKVDNCENEHPLGDDNGGAANGSDDKSGSNSGSSSSDSSSTSSGSGSGSGSDDSSNSGSNSGSGSGDSSGNSGKGGGHDDPTPHS